MLASSTYYLCGGVRESLSGCYICCLPFLIKCNHLDVSVIIDGSRCTTSS